MDRLKSCRVRVPRDSCRGYGSRKETRQGQSLMQSATYSGRSRRKDLYVLDAIIGAQEFKTIQYDQKLLSPQG